MATGVHSTSPSPPAGEGLGRGEAPLRSLLLERAKAMRSNPTEAERRLWAILRNKRLAGFKFKRQVVVDHYIVDFMNFEHRLIVEADGSQHADSPADVRRDAYLAGQDFRVLRFWNNDILAQPENVAEAIWHALQRPLPSAAVRLPPSPARGEGNTQPHTESSPR